MKKHLSYISETDQKKEFYHNVQNRHIDQKFLYLDKSSVEVYYKTTHKHISKKSTDISDKSCYTTLKKYIQKDIRTAIISLGCGNSGIEKQAIKQLVEEGYKIMYVGVDTSQEMLDLAEKNLSDIKTDKIFLHIDMVDGDFKEEITEVTKHCGKNIFGFLGGTLGNVNQTHIADSMYNTLGKGDLLWIGVKIQPNPTMEENMKLFNYYAKYLSDGTEKMWFKPLEEIGVPFSAGRMNIKMTHEHSVGALLFIFYFTFDKKVIVDMDGKKIHFLPNEEVQLQNIRAYHPETLIQFFEEHEFKFLDMIDRKNDRKQFVFKK